MDGVETSVLTMPAQWFVHPWAFWLLAGLPFLAGLAWLAVRRRRKIRGRLGSASAVQALVSRRSGLGALRAPCVFTGLAFLCVGIAGPQWGRDWEQAVASGGDLVVLLDLSRSMLAQDVLPSRLERAKQSLRGLSYAIQERGGHRLALVIFAARARIVCPLTHDYDHFRLTLARQTPADLSPDLRPRPSGPTSGTRIGAGLKMAVQAATAESTGPKLILMVSDGDDPARDDEWGEGARFAARHKIPVVVMGVGRLNTLPPDNQIPWKDDWVRHENGTPVATKLEEKPLQEIARLTGGNYTRAGTTDKDLDLTAYFKDWIEQRTLRSDAGKTSPTYVQRYPWFFGTALVLFSTAMLIGNVRVRRPAGPETPPGPLQPLRPGQGLIEAGQDEPSDSDRLLAPSA
jgi:Ca-activated chloride channel family protein